VSYTDTMQTAFHVISLVAEARNEIVGGSIVATQFYKKARTAVFLVKTDKSQIALGFFFSPSGSGTIVVPSSKLSVESTEKPWPIFAINSGTVSSIEQIGFDRVFRMTITNDLSVHHLAFEAIGPNGNIWFLDDNDRVLGTLRNRAFAEGDIYSPPALPDKLNPMALTSDTLLERFSSIAECDLAPALDKNILGLNRTLAREVVHRARLADRTSATLTPDDCRTLHETIALIASFFAQPEKGLLYSVEGAAEVYPFKLASITQEPEKFKTFSLAVMESTQRKQTASEVRDDRKDIVDAVNRAIKRLEGRIAKLEINLAQARDFEQYRRYGDLLKINFDKIRRGMKDLQVENVFGDSQESITISLDSALSPNENVEAYYQKHRKGREGQELLERRREVSIGELAQLNEIARSLESDFASARERFTEEIIPLLPREASGAMPQVRLPYKAHQLSTGVTIFVGRDGSDNDRTTFEFAKPFELWFHTQQCPGSHVVMKFPNKQFQPSRREIEEAASVAAWFSKARNDSLVPVCYAERRHVRKPRKAKPGLVTVEKEKSVMVVPRKPSE
jgi:predicted ribosome quality control (RQC) complex YloA/Tae2 family protein